MILFSDAFRTTPEFLRVGRNNCFSSTLLMAIANVRSGCTSTVYLLALQPWPSPTFQLRSSFTKQVDYVKRNNGFLRMAFHTALFVGHWVLGSFSLHVIGSTNSSSSLWHYFHFLLPNSVLAFVAWKPVLLKAVWNYFCHVSVDWLTEFVDDVLPSNKT